MISVIIFSVSLIMLTVSVFYTRLFSILYWHNSAFTVLSVAMIGLSVAGLLVYFMPRWFAREKIKSQLCLLMPFYAISILASYLGILWAAKLVTARDFLGSLLNILPVISIALVPFFVGGLIITLILSAFHERISRLYCWDMLGAALGALLALGLINWVGGQQLMILLPVIVTVIGIATSLAWKHQAGLASCSALIVILGGMAFIPSMNNLLEIRFAKGNWEPYSPHEVWAPAARVKSFGGQNARFQIDSGVITPILPFKGELAEMDFLKRNILQLGYHLGPYDKVAIIGPGGGSDVLAALVFKNKDITAIEINSGIVRLMKNELVDFNGGLYLRPEVKVVVDEGRSFLSRTPEKFNFIQATFIDTYAAAASGAHTLNENYVYTTGAIKDYFAKLSDDGVISISRWGGPLHGYSETFRVIATAERALREMGIADPRSHILSIRGPLYESGHRMGYQSHGNVTNSMATTLISKQPFSLEKLEKIKSAVAEYRFQPIWFPYANVKDDIVEQLFNSRGNQGFYNSFYNKNGVNIAPTTDDAPFFFNFIRPVDYLSQSERDPREALQPYSSNMKGLSALHQTGFALIILLTLLIILPLLLRRGDIYPIESTKYFLGYFMCLGIGFMGIEIGLMQKFSLFLGHPVYSLSVVLAGLLMFSAIGSLLTEKIQNGFSKSARNIAFLLSVTCILYAYFIPPLLHMMLSIPMIIKVVIALMMIAPLGIMMGMLYPLGIKSLLADKQKIIPWVWGINTGFSVFATVISLYLAMSFGFTATWLVFTAIYLFAALLMSRVSKVHYKA
jgi:spermidine synthase